MKRFYEAIYGDSTGWVAVVTRSEYSQDPDSEKWLELPRQFDYMVKYSELRAVEDVYCSTAVFSDKMRTKADTGAKSRVVYADADTCDPENFRLPPSIVVQTSEGRWHCWWVLDEEVSAAQASEASHRIAIAHEAQGCDKSGWIVSKILRVPGTTNSNHETPEPVTAYYSGQVYTLDTINDVYRDIDLTPRVTLTGERPEPVSQARLNELEQELETAGLSSLYLEKPHEGQSWSERLFKLELELFRMGMNPQEVFSVAKESSCNKYNPEYAGQHTQTGVSIPRRNDPDGVLWADVQKAYAEYEATKDIPTEEVIRKVAAKAEFLSIDERRLLKERPCFVDEYVAWVATRTDSAETYQRTLSFLLLSSIFGNRGFISTPWGGTNLNIWALILGDSTHTRKTTAVKLYLKVLHAYEGITASMIDIGDDVTTEALLKTLGTRDGQVSVLHTDEVSGFFKENMAKNYRVGTLETFTALYDGEVPVVLRATKDSGNKNRARTVFNFVGIGIREHVAHILTKEHFESGFLARALWSVADPPAWSVQDEHLPLLDNTEDDEIEYNRDEQVDLFASDLAVRASLWSDTQPSKFRFDKSAKTRINKWTEDGARYLIDSDSDKVLRTAYDRLKWSVTKAATLLAMYDQSKTVTMTHTLHALAQAELWFNDMIRMSAEVSSSDFERRCDDVEQFISSGESRMRIESSVRKKFARLKPAECDEVIKALMLQGRIRRSPQARTKLEAL